MARWLAWRVLWRNSILRNGAAKQSCTRVARLTAKFCNRSRGAVPRPARFIPCRLFRVARSLGGVPVIVDGNKKISYHAAGMMVAGLGLALAEGATQVLLSIGFTRRKALQALLPLMREMLRNFEQHGAHAAWTGPISRADYGTIALHAAALRKHPNELQEAYRGLARLSARLLSKSHRATLRNLNRVLGKSRRKSK